MQPLGWEGGRARVNQCVCARRCGRSTWCRGTGQRSARRARTTRSLSLSVLWLWLSLSLTLPLHVQVTVFHEDTVVYSATYDHVYDQHSEQVREIRG